MSRIVLATASLAFEQRVRDAYSGTLNGDLRRWQDSDLTLVDSGRRAAEMGTQDPELVVVGPDIPSEVAMNVARVFDEQRPEISVVIVAEPSPTLWQEALRVGVRDVIAPDAPTHEMRRAFDRAIEIARKRKSSLLDEAGGSGPVGRVITVLSPKGGAGKTAIASNLAVTMARAAPGEVALVDLDLQFGDVAQVLGLRPEHTILDAARVPGRLDMTMLKVFLTARHGDLFVLCAPDSPAEGEEVSDARVARTLQLLAGHFSYVIVDTAAGLTEATLAALDSSTDFLLVCDLAVSAGRGMRKVVDALDRLGMTKQRRHLVLNRADSKVGVDAAEIAAMVGLDVDIEVPSARLVPLTMNQGEPLVETEPRSPVAGAIEHVAERFVDDLELVGARRSGGFLGLRRG